MLTPNNALSLPVLHQKVNMPVAAADNFAEAAKSHFISFFQNRGFYCAFDADQQLKATCNRLKVRFSVSDPKIASDQGHAVCYLSFAPINRCYKIAITPASQSPAAGNAYTYTLLEDAFVRTPALKPKNSTYHSLEELLNTIFSKSISFTGVIRMHSFFNFLF